MDKKLLHRLNKLAKRNRTFEEFLIEVGKWPGTFAVVEPKIWNKLDYKEFYYKVKEGKEVVL